MGTTSKQAHSAILGANCNGGNLKITLSEAISSDINFTDFMDHTR